MSVIGQTAAAIAPRRGAARIRDFAPLTKPRVMSLVLFTALVGYTVAPGRRDALTGCLVLLSIASGAGGAGALNMWYEADLDAAMTRTAGRPLPRGRVSRSEALAFGLALAGGGVHSRIIRNSSSGSSPTVPVAATQPMTGGNAPAAPPITMFCGVRRFSHIVYMTT